jgi:thioesterase domain-containing protein/acyl carrier protein
VDTFLLSCRALGRGVEHAMIRYLGKIANQWPETTHIKLPFKGTSKNQPARQFVQELASQRQVEATQSGQHSLTLLIPAKVAKSVRQRFDGADIAPPPPNSSVPVSANGASIAVPIEQQLLAAAAITQQVKTAKGKRSRLTQSNYVAPRNDHETKLLEIFKDLTQTDQISVTDSFFDIGGQSITAVQLISLLKTQFDVEYPITTFFLEPTVAKIAANILNKTYAQNWSPLLPLQPYGLKPPVFCIHPAGGTVVVYMKLAKLLGTERPFYGIQAQGIESGQTPITAMEEMVAFYLQEIKTVQPTGPYYLAGWSGGGHIALELAQQLKKNSDQVRSLFIIDTPAKMSAALQDDVSYFTNFFTTGIETPEEVLRSLTAEQFMQEFVKRAQKGKLLSQDCTAEEAQRLFEVIKANMDISYNYEPQNYDGKIVFFSATNEKGTDQHIDLSEDWKNCVNPDLDVYYIPANHSTIIKQTKNARIVAKHMLIQLNKEGRTN